MYHPLYHLVWRVGNASDVCVTGVTYEIGQLLANFVASFENGQILCCTCAPDLASFGAIGQF